MERWFMQSKLYTVGPCICLRLRFSVTARWQMCPQAIIVCLSHSSSHLILSLSLLTSAEEAKKSLLSSPLPLIVNHRHLLIEELTSFYSRTKDTFCHLWLLQGTVRVGQYHMKVRERREAKEAKNHPSRFLLLFNATLTALQISAKVCPNSAKCTLLCVTDINPHLSVCSKSGLSQPVSTVDTIVSRTEP